jgi:hypothetical protein
MFYNDPLTKNLLIELIDFLGAPEITFYLPLCLLWKYSYVSPLFLSGSFPLFLQTITSGQSYAS